MEDTEYPIYPDIPIAASPEEKRSLVHSWGENMERCRVRAALISGAIWMEWVSSEDGKVCPACSAANGKIMRASDMDVSAHFKACSNPDGCRCICGPVHLPISYRRVTIFNLKKGMGTK